MANEIPQSAALAEATPDSLTELFSRDPEHLSKQDRSVIIDSLRAQRARLAKVEAAAPARSRSQPKTPLLDKATKSMDDMGL